MTPLSNKIKTRELESLQTTIIKDTDEKKFLKELDKILKVNPNAKIHYSAGAGAGIGGSSKYLYSALVVY